MKKIGVLVLLGALSAISVPAQADPVVNTTGVETAFMAFHSGRCLDNNGSTQIQTPIVQNACNGSNTQQWELVRVGGNAFQLRNDQSQLCLDVPGNTVSGTVLVQHTCHIGNNQQWTLVPANAKIATVGFKIRSVYSGKCADVFAFNLNDGANVVQWDCLVGFDNQDWSLA